MLRLAYDGRWQPAGGGRRENRCHNVRDGTPRPHYRRYLSVALFCCCRNSQGVTRSEEPVTRAGLLKKFWPRWQMTTGLIPASNRSSAASISSHRQRSSRARLPEEFEAARSARAMSRKSAAAWLKGVSDDEDRARGRDTCMPIAQKHRCSKVQSWERPARSGGAARLRWRAHRSAGRATYDEELRAAMGRDRIESASPATARATSPSTPVKRARIMSRSARSIRPRRKRCNSQPTSNCSNGGLRQRRSSPSSPSAASRSRTAKPPQIDAGADFLRGFVRRVELQPGPRRRCEKHSTHCSRVDLHRSMYPG